MSGLSGYSTGSIVSASTFGDLFCRSSQPSSPTRSGCVPERCSVVSAEVENEFISTNLTLLPNDSLIFLTYTCCHGCDLRGSRGNESRVDGVR